MLRNDSRRVGRNVRLRLIGTSASRDALGTRVECRLTEHTWTLLVPAGGGYQASSDSRLPLAVDDGQMLEELHVIWSTGREEVWKPINHGSEIILIEGRKQDTKLKMR